MARNWQRGSLKSRTRTVDGREVTMWTAVFRDVSGRRHKQSFPSKGDGTAWLRKSIAAVSGGTYIAPAPAVTFRQFVDKWLADRSAALQPATIRTYRTLFGLDPESTRRPRRVPSPIQAWGDRKIATLTTGDMVEHFKALTGLDGLAATAVQNIRAGLSTVFSDAIAGGYLQVHPLKNRLVKLPKAQRSHRKLNKAPSFETAARFVNWLQVHEPSVYAYVLLLCGCSLRPGEAAAVRVGDVDRVRGLVTISQKRDPRARIIAAPKTEAARRSVQAGPAVLAALDAVLVARFGSVSAAPAEAIILDGLDTERLRKNRASGWNAMLRAAGCEHLTAYSLRHFFASGHLARGRSLAWVSQQMGHTKVSTTLNAYADVVTSGRDGDALVAELLSGDNLGTSAVGKRPEGSDDVRVGVAQVPNRSANV